MDSSEYTFMCNSTPMSIVADDDDVSVAVRCRVHFENIITIQTDPASIKTSHNSKPTNYKNVFSTPYMELMVQQISEKYASDYTVPSEFFPSNCDFNKTLKGCTCCLCNLRHINAEVFELCIKNHPLKEACQRGKPLRINRTMRKYQRQHVCDECLYTTVFNSKRSQKYGYRCIFSSCSHKPYISRKTSEFRKHYLKHLGVNKNFICSICERNYASLNSVKKHERTHAK